VAIDKRLRAETVQGAALALEGIDNVERSDSLALGVFSVGDRVADNVLELYVSAWPATCTGRGKGREG
jgi:hypothetical protein